MSKTYRINEVFYSVQGEGMRAGTANVFVRFTGCNMQCVQEAGPKSPGGFDCDTEFASGTPLNIAEILVAIGVSVVNAIGAEAAAKWMTSPDRWLVLTGGEPALQVDADLCDALHGAGYKLAIETNGSILLPKDDLRFSMISGQPQNTPSLLDALLGCFKLDWITVSPKVAEHAIRQTVAHEVKYVRGAGQAVPKTAVTAHHRLVSPSFNGLVMDSEAVRTCLKIVRENPEWRLSVQFHKSLGVR